MSPVNDSESRPARPAVSFPVMAWDFPDVGLPMLREMKECGLTHAGFVPPSGLDACRESGLSAIVHDPRTYRYDWTKIDEGVARRNAESLVRELGAHPSVFGFYVMDEPSADQFAGLAVMSRALHALAPGKWPYINLFPNYASADQLRASTYEEYIERFVASCRPRLLSYDNYWLMLAKPESQAFYWRNLDQMRSLSQRHGIPFWNIVLSVAHFHYRQTADADLRLQMYSTLAYGARGISYYTYHTPTSGNYRLAPIDQFGHKTCTWDAMRNVNLQLRALAPTMLDLTSTLVYHIGDVPDGCRGAPPEAIVSSLAGATLLVGEFRHADGGTYAMVVNKDLENSTAPDLAFRNHPSDVQLVSAYTGQLVPLKDEWIWLAPGQGILLRLR